MSKQITLDQFNDAIKPLIEAVTRLTQSDKSNSTQIHDLHRMMSDMSIKFDLLEHSISNNANVVRPAGKKLTGRKNATVKKVVKKVDESGSESESESDTESKSETKPEAKKLPIKKSVVVKKAPKKIESAKKPSFNKMTYFKEEFTKNEATFEDVFTTKVMASLDKQVGDFADEKKYAAARLKLYYNYIRDNHADVLDEHKTRFNDSLEANDSLESESD